MHRYRLNDRRRGGFTLIELLVVVACVVVLLVIVGGVLLLRSASKGMATGLQTARTSARQLRCATQNRSIVQAMVTWASNNGGVYPLPSALDTKDETVAEKGQGKDTTGNILSLLIFNGHVSPEIIVCPNETNPNIVVDGDYQLTYPKAGVKPGDSYWDPAFNADFTRPDKPGNVSFAHSPPVGSRLEVWSDTFNGQEAVFGDRGPEIASATDRADGGKNHTLANPASRSLGLHGDGKAWGGNIAYNDGHVSFETALTPVWSGPTAITYTDTVARSGRTRSSSTNRTTRRGRTSF